MTSTAPKLKVSYFDFRARGEVTRLVLQIGGIAFEDERVSFADWSTRKATTTFGQLPSITIDGKTTIAQSHAIERYVSVLTGLYPADPVRAALVDQVHYSAQDMFEAIYRTPKEAEAKAATRAELASTKFPTLLAGLEKAIGEHGGGKWAVGDALSLADVSIYVSVAELKTGLWDGIPTDLADKYPHVMRIYEAVKSHPRMVEWVAAHPYKA
ncbi:glutathione S-transferase [Entophlyctis helioformis]|nr:glutathione S-transferase [Entophlyctis helioformis]